MKGLLVDQLYSKIDGYDEVEKARIFEIKDIGKRLGVISPERLFINGFPIRNPIAAFNPSIVRVGDDVFLYPRVIVGYYKYVSAIVEARLQLQDILSGQVNLDYYSSSLAILPSTIYDLWGAEDPRTYMLDGRITMTYTGRTISYFAKDSVDKTLPITAYKDKDRWVKWLIHKPREEESDNIINDKNSFILKYNNRIFFFHRPQDKHRKYYLVISELPEPDMSEELVEVVPIRDWLAMPPASFEEKIGWGTPPLDVGGHKFLFILHGVGKRLQAYRAFAALIDLGGKEPVLDSVTPYYIMAPREPYEIYGDRPHIIFPGGAVRIDDEILISYGAADYMIAFAKINYTELMQLLDKHRFY